MALPDWFQDSARQLIGADTVSARGNGAAVALLEPLYRESGLAVVRQAFRESIDGAPEAEHINLLAGPGGAGPWRTSEARAELAAGRIPACARGGVLLVTHTDTVPPGPPALWTETAGDPHRLTAKAGWLFGLGVADVKLDALCKIAAARRLREVPLARPFWLCGTAAEEVGLRGARRLAASDLFASLGVRQVLCGEPSELGLILAHKGYAVVRCTLVDQKARLIAAGDGSDPTDPGAQELEFHGRAAHSSTPQLGVNAIHRALAWTREAGSCVLGVRGGASANTVPALCTVYAAGPAKAAAVVPDRKTPRPLAPGERRADLWRALQTAGALEELWLSLVKKLAPTEDARFDPPGAVGGFNVVSGDTLGTQAPEALHGAARVEALFDARLLPTHDPDELLQAFEHEARAWVERLGGGEVTLTVSVERNAGGMALSPGSPLVRAVSETLTSLGLDGTPRAKPTSTEAGVFARRGCEAIVIGPGRSTGNAHTANERIEVAQLERAIDLYEAVLRHLCSTSSPRSEPPCT